MTARRPRAIVSAGGWCAPANGFRAFGAGVVLLGHVLLATRTFPVRGLIHVGSVVVPCFFVITAASLHRPFLVAQLRGEPAPSAGQFWWKRFLRLYPLYAAALTTYLVLIPATRPASGSVADYLCLYALLQVYVPHLATHSGIPAAWFLCDEVGFYAVLPALAAGAGLLAVRRSRRPTPTARTTLRAHTVLGTALIVIGLATRTGLVVAGQHSVAAWTIGNLDFYGFGILLAVAGLRERAGLPIPGWARSLRVRPHLPVVAWFVGLVIMTMTVRDPGAVSSAAEILWRYAVYWLVIVPTLTVLYLGPQRTGFNRLLASAWLRRPSAISLHIYLWQQLVLAGLGLWLGDLARWSADRPGVGVAGLLLATAALTTAWSQLTAPLVDRPYRSWAASPPGRRAAPPPRSRPGPPRPQATGSTVGRTALVLLLVIGAAGAVGAGAATLVPHGHDAPPPRAPLGPGQGWLTMADGTQLSAWVHLPGPVDRGPYPTVIEYSGYQDSGPGWARARPLTAAAQRLGFATVSVTVRGIGCSGGRFELVGSTQAADGRRVVQTIARQPWVRGHRVGLIGFSYGALGALEVAGTAPPALSGVVALSPYGQARDLFHPGGLTNDGFARGWLQSLRADARPRGTPWVRRRIRHGDHLCARNQGTRGSVTGPDLVSQYLDRVDPAWLRAASPATWAATTRVPVLLAGTLQDAALGSDLADQLHRFPAATTHLILTNGTHADSLAPQVVGRVQQFLDLFVAHRVRPTAVTQAQASYWRAPAVEVLLESGAASPPGSAAAGGSVSISGWPPPNRGEQTWPLTGARGRFSTDPGRSGQAYEIEGADLRHADLPSWPAPDPSTTVAWLGPPVTSDALLLGDGRADLWVRATTRAPQLQISVTAVSPDGQETFVRATWARVTAPGGGAAAPGTWTRVPVRIGPLAEVLRAGSRLRFLIGTPGAGQVQWSFRPDAGGPSDIQIGASGPHASRVQLPVAPVSSWPGAVIAGVAPRCGDLRGQPCRPYQPFP